jgi:hypothetical protein
MKINSHLIVLGIGAIAVGAWLFTRPKVLEQADGWTFCQKGKLFYAFFGNEGGTIAGDTRSPDLESLVAVKAWVAARRGVTTAADAVKNILPWEG